MGNNSSAELKALNLPSFDCIYEQIFTTHQKAEKIKYELSAEALDIYVKHVGEGNNGNGRGASSGNMKDEKKHCMQPCSDSCAFHPH